LNILKESQAKVTKFGGRIALTPQFRSYLPIVLSSKVLIEIKKYKINEFLKFELYDRFMFCVSIIKVEQLKQE